MGAGCYYTHKETGTKAFWIDLDNLEYDENDSDQYEDNFWFEVENIKTQIHSLNYEIDRFDRLKLYNGLAEVKLESTYYGDGIVVLLEPNQYQDSALFNLFLANHNRMYNRIKRKLLQAGYKLRIATGGFTSMEVTL
jgi:hypothetical protein